MVGGESGLRAARQQRGELPAGEAQRSPRYMQVYIDDFSGCALDDVVTPTPSVHKCVDTLS